MIESVVMFFESGDSVYFVDRDHIEEMLIYIDSCIETFETQRMWDSRIEQLALERLAHVLIEAIVDVGQQMIDGFVMRDAGSYVDIIDILNDEQVVSEEDATALKEVVEARKSLVRSYISVDHRRIDDLLQRRLPSFKAFSPSVRRYLDEELGPVSAFLPKDE